MKKLTRILGVILTTALALTMFVGVIPVGAEPGENAWGEIDLPPVDDWEDTDTGVMAITPDGAMMFLSVYVDGFWDIVVSDDGGFTWSDTSLTGLNDPDDSMTWGDWVTDFTPVDIVVSPDWPDDDTVYVGCLNGTVYRIPDAGEGDPVTLIPMVDSYGEDITTKGMLYDLDIWHDGTNNWLVAATDLDVFIIKDALFELWRDMEMETEGTWGYAVQVDFAPDFASSNLLWAIRADSSNELYLTSTVSPGQWGVHVDEVWFENQDPDYIWWTPFVDVAFPDTYDSDNPQLWVAIAEDDFADEGNLWLVNGALMPGTSTAQPIFDDDVDLGSVEVSGYVILVKEFNGGRVWISTDGAGTFNEATRSPGGGNLYWGHLYMAPGAFDPDEGVAYCTGLGGDSAVSRTVNGGDTWHQISYIDAQIDELEDIAFAPMTASQPAFLLTDDYTGPSQESLWYTADVAAEDVQWIRVGTEDTFGWNHMANLEYALDGSGLIMFVVDGGDLELHKSTNNGDTFMEWRDVPAGAGWVYDFIVADGVTIYAATDQGFWGTSAFGPPNLVTLSDSGSSVAVMDDMVAVGTWSGDVHVSDDGGATFGDAINAGSGATYVAFGPDGSLYAATAGSTVVVLDDDEFVDVEDSTEATATTPDGFVGIKVSPDDTLYAMSMGSTGTGSSTAGTVEVDDFHLNSMQLLSLTDFGHATVFFADNADNTIMPLTGTFADGELLTVIASSLIWQTTGPVVHGAIVVEGAESGAMGTVAIYIDSGIAVGGPPADGAPLYVTGGVAFTDVTSGTSTVTPAADACLWRLLIGEEDNLWESACIDGAVIVEGLWLTEGSNLLWTLTDPEAVEDPINLGLWGLEDFLTGPVTLTAPADGETVAGFTSATLEWEELDTAEGYDVGGDFDATTDETELDVSSLTDNTEYEWMVRANAPWQSRWSAAWTFTTSDFVDAPGILVPLMGSQDYTTYPSFVWSSVSGADEYELEISANPDFSDAIAVTTTLTQYTQTTALDFDHNYYWRVRATSSIGGVSAWTVGNFHTGMEAQPPVVVEENPPANITLTVPQPETPGYIWAIIAVGAILTIAVIVLIVRTRRVV